MIDQPYAGATPEQLKHPMVQELLAVHGMFRREIASMLSFVEKLIVGDSALDAADVRARVQLLTGAAFRYTSLLHHHHQAESMSMFPMLRGQGLKPDVLARLEAEHDEIAVMIDALDVTLKDVAKVDPRALNTDLQLLSQKLSAHLAYEETQTCPLLAHFSNW